MKRTFGKVILSTLKRGHFTCFFLFLILGAGLFVSQHSFWVLSLASGEKIFWIRGVEPGDTFQLGYLHSIALSDVWENFLIDPAHRIVLTETQFQGQGAGLPYHLAPGERLSREGRWFRISGMKRVVPSISSGVNPYSPICSSVFLALFSMAFLAFL